VAMEAERAEQAAMSSGQGSEGLPAPAAVADEEAPKTRKSRSAAR
jgi:hypothetical protein